MKAGLTIDVCEYEECYAATAFESKLAAPRAGFRPIPGFIVRVTTTADRAKDGDFGNKEVIDVIQAATSARLHRLLHDRPAQLGPAALLIESSDDSCGYRNLFTSDAIDLEPLRSRLAGSYPAKLTQHLPDFLDRFSTIVLGKRTALIERLGATARASGYLRVWQLPQQSILDVIHADLNDSRSDLSSFPVDLERQLLYVIRHVIQSHERLGTILILVQLGYRRYNAGVTCSGIISDLRTIDGQLGGCMSETCTLEDLEGGWAEYMDVESYARANPAISSVLRPIARYLRIARPVGASASFVVVGGELMIDEVPTRHPGCEDLLRAVSASLSSRADRETNAISNRTKELIQAIAAPDLLRLTLPTVAEGQSARILATGIAAGPGVVSGALCMTRASSSAATASGKAVVFAAQMHEPELIPEILAARGLVLVGGGATSHAAVVARCSGKPCVVGVSGLTLDVEGGIAFFLEEEVRSGAMVTVDGTRGVIYAGELALSPAVESNRDLSDTLACCDQIADIAVYANADTADEARRAFELGATGIGLCRIEHLLLKSKALRSVQTALVLGWLVKDKVNELQLAEADAAKWHDSKGARSALEAANACVASCPLCTRFFAEIDVVGRAVRDELIKFYEVAGNREVIVRLLDPPIAEFVDSGVIESLRELLSAKDLELLKTAMANTDSSLGLRGVRLSIVLPHFGHAQLRGILDAARFAGCTRVSILVPFVIGSEEMARVGEMLHAELGKDEAYAEIRCSLGAMIETPRAALMAGELAECADFLSFGTNDLSQFVWAASRDHAEREFLEVPPYTRMSSPFSNLDIAAVGKLLSFAAQEIRQRRKSLRVGICGEHASDPSIMSYLRSQRINYVSCPPFRIPQMRLASAQAVLSVGPLQ